MIYSDIIEYNIVADTKSTSIERIQLVGSDNKGILACHGHRFEECPVAFDMNPFTDRANSLESGITFSLMKIFYYQKPKFEFN